MTGFFEDKMIILQCSSRLPQTKKKRRSGEGDWSVLLPEAERVEHDNRMRVGPRISACNCPTGPSEVQLPATAFQETNARGSVQTLPQCVHCPDLDIPTRPGRKQSLLVRERAQRHSFFLLTVYKRLAMVLSIIYRRLACRPLNLNCCRERSIY